MKNGLAFFAAEFAMRLCWYFDVKKIDECGNGEKEYSFDQLNGKIRNVFWPPKRYIFRRNREESAVRFPVAATGKIAPDTPECMAKRNQYCINFDIIRIPLAGYFDPD